MCRRSLEKKLGKLSREERGVFLSRRSWAKPIPATPEQAHCSHLHLGRAKGRAMRRPFGWSGEQSRQVERSETQLLLTAR